MASVVQGHRDPFGRKLIDYNIPQLDFVLEMAALDEPDRWTFVRGGKGASVSAPESMARWKDVLGGSLLGRFMGMIGATKGMANVAAWRKRQARGFTPGVTTRGGKPIGGDAGTGSKDRGSA